MDIRYSCNQRDFKYHFTDNIVTWEDKICGWKKSLN